MFSRIPQSTTLHFATRVRTWLVVRLCSARVRPTLYYFAVKSLFQKPSCMSHVHITFLDWNERKHDLPEHWRHLLRHLFKSVVEEYIWWLLFTITRICTETHMHKYQFQHYPVLASLLYTTVFHPHASPLGVYVLPSFLPKEICPSEYKNLSFQIIWYLLY
jgi:hypothetical protein